MPRRHPRFSRSICLAALTVAAAAFPAAPARATDPLDEIGFNRLLAGGKATNLGRGFTVAQIETVQGGGFSPDATNAEFAGKRFILKSNPLPVSGHATGVGTMYYGRTSGVARGIQRIVSMTDTDFATGKGLRVGNPTFAPVDLNLSILNNSWIGDFNSDALNTEAIRRLDYMIERDNVLVTNALDNGAASAFPKLLAPAYNGVTVGNADSSSGPIAIDGPAGRSKVDIIAPQSLTSWAAPLVAGSGAVLLSEAKARGWKAGPIAVKAMLMAGAQRLAGWRRGGAGAADDEAHPLDYDQGAGQLRIDNAFKILSQGPQRPGRLATRTGWDLRTMRTGAGYDYSFRLTKPVEQFTAMLSWFRHIEGMSGGQFDQTATVRDLKLVLAKKVGTTWRRVFKSDSPVDNVESITMDDLSAGNYRLMVRGDGAETYALAWFANDNPTLSASLLAPMSLPQGLPIPSDADAGFSSNAVPEPSGVAVVLAGAAGLLARRRRRGAARPS